MLLDERCIALGLYKEKLNKAQLELLGENYPPLDGWESRITNLDILTRDFNLFLFLRGDLSLKAQKQIISNYSLVADFHKSSKETSLVQTKSKPIKTHHTLTIYCDGACQGNPGKAGSGIAIYEANSNPTLLYGDFVANGTNNIAELQALKKALLISKETPKSIIYSDSKYSIDCITKWAYNWQKNNWQKKGGEIKNLKLIKEIHTLYDSIKDKITIKHIKGHSGVEGNELSDRMAVYAIKSQSREYKEYEYSSVGEVLV